MYNSGMKRESDTSPYDQIASEYDDLFGDQNPYYQSVNRCERELFEKWINRSNNHQRAMDIGCGTGFHTKWLVRSEEHTSELQSLRHLVCRLLLEKKHSTCRESHNSFRVGPVGATPRVPLWW